MQHKLTLVVTLLVLGSTGAVADQTGQSLTVETIESGASSPSVDRLDNETWLVPKEATPVYVSGTTARADGTVVTLHVVWENEPIQVGETEAEDGRWNTTVDLTDVPTGTHTLNVTAGATTTAVRIEVVHVLRTPSMTPTATVEASTAEATTSVASTRTATLTERQGATTATTRTDVPGFTVGISFVSFLVGVGLLGRRWE